MKNLKNLLFLLLAVLCSSFVLPLNSFHIDKEEHTVYFKKSYNDTATAAQLLKHLTQTLNVSNVKQADNIITMQYSDAPKWRAAGFKKFKTPFIFQDANMQGKAAIELTQGGYQLTIKNIEFQYKKSRSTLYKKNDITTIEEQFLKRSKPEWKHNYKKYLLMLEQTIDRTFAK